jgi:hypothetical protein
MLHLLGEHERASARLAPDNDAAEVPAAQPSLAAKGKCLCSWRETGSNHFAREPGGGCIQSAMHVTLPTSLPTTANT